MTNNLKKLREACLLSQEQVADTLGIHRTTYTYYESGKSFPPIKKAKKLAKIFGVSIEALFDEDVLNNTEQASANLFREQFHDYNSTGESSASELSFAMLSSSERYMISNFRLLPSEEQDRILNEILSISGGKK